MGGLIARWCLKDMEDRGLQHNVANYFSYDAPQQGANIPLGMQYIFKEIARDLPYLKWVNAGGFRDLSNAFASPAARQMLVTYGSYSNGPFNWVPDLYTLNPLRAAFAQRLQSKGYPQQTKNFGIAFGRGNNITNKDAGDGKQFTSANPFNPQSLIFAGSIGLLVANLEADGYAVPENNNKATIGYYSFFGLTFRNIFGIIPFPRILLRIRRFDYTGQYPYDDGQGSFEQTQTDFAQSWFPGVGMPATTNSHDGHNFVATASALDLQNQTYNSTTSWQSANIFYNIDNQIQNIGAINGNTLITPTLSPFKAVMTGTSDCALTGGCSAEPYLNEKNTFIFPPNSNQWNHFHNTGITFQVAHFIERNILNVQPVDCAGTNGLCNSSATISGPTIICTTGQYQLNNVPNGVTLKWEFLSGRLLITNGQGTSIINVINQNSGSETIKVTMTNTCGASVILNKTIQVGTYTHSQYTIYSNPSPICYGYNAQFGPLAGQVPDATSYSWIYPSGGFTYISGQGTRVITLKVPIYSFGQTGGDVGLGVGNACGVSSYFPLTHFNYSGCSCCTFSGFNITASPNPASNNINVGFTDVIDTTVASPMRMIESMGKTIMTLYDFNTSMVVKQWIYNEVSSNSYNLNIAGLKQGIYVLQADRDNHAKVTKIIIE